MEHNILKSSPDGKTSAAVVAQKLELEKAMKEYALTKALEKRPTAADLVGYDDVVLATGVTPRVPAIAGINHPMVVSYAEALTGAPVGPPAPVPARL